MPAAKKESSPDRVKPTRWFLHDAYTDYVAARVLLLRGLLKQGVVLSSTAIEKCAKAVLALHGNTSRGHLNTAHFNVLRTDPKFGNLLNPDFIKLNQKAYRLRYTDDLPFDFNMVVASREFLAEMDQTILSVTSCFKIHDSGRHRPIGYEAGIQRGDEHLIAENHVITHEPLERFIYAKPQFVYEVCRDPLRGLVEATYMTETPPRRIGFLRAGLALREGSREDFESSYFPISGTFTLFAEGSELVGKEFSSD